MTNNESRTERITQQTALSIAIGMIFLIPLGYFLLSYSYERKILNNQLKIQANSLSRYIYANPYTWQYQATRIQEILRENSWSDRQLYHAVFDAKGNLITSIGVKPSEFSYKHVEKLKDRFSIRGQIASCVSFNALTLSTSLVFLLSCLFAYLIYYFLNIVPFASIKRLLNQLQNSEAKLRVEVKEKKFAVQEYQQLNKIMHYQANHDPLTRLPNRINFKGQLDSLFKNQKFIQTSIAIMIIDLNHFKEINDTLGHAFGDQLLIAIARRLRSILPKQSHLARLGGDEFALLIPSTNLEKTEYQAQLVADSFQHYIVIEDYHLSIQASIGIAQYPEHGFTSEMLLQHADVAMYHCKENDLPYCFYTKQIDENKTNIINLRSSLKHAIENQLLELYFQPKVDLASGLPVSVETFSRWNHPEYGLVSPDVFIPIAEQAGMINALTEMVLDKALQEYASWEKYYWNLKIAVNISARNLQNENLYYTTLKLLDYYKVNPRNLIIEITESSVMRDPKRSLQLLNKFSQHGIHISIDDFGAGYSSLAYLKKLTLRELKIDKSFILNMLSSYDDQVIVRSTIDMAHNLNLIVVAEGVENPDTKKLLREFECDLIQGFFISEPLTAKQLKQWMPTHELNPC